MGPGDGPKYPKEVSAKKTTKKNLNLKKLHQISENSPTGERPLTRQRREAQRIAIEIPSGQLIIGRNEQIAGHNMF